MLHYNWHRYYDPIIGRYVSADPIGQRGGVNLYAYATNNPLRNVDLDGLSPDGAASSLKADFENSARKSTELKECTGGPPTGCFQDCINRTYGDAYFVAESLSPLSALGLAQEFATSALESSVGRQSLRSLNSGTGVGFSAGVRQARTLAQFSAFNAVSSVVGAGAAGFQVTAALYCASQCR